MKNKYAFLNELPETMTAQLNGEPSQDKPMVAQSKKYYFCHVNIEKDEDPTEFFNWALKNKLYKSVKDISFTSHMKIIYENQLEVFNGISAVIAFDDQTKRPVSIALLKHFINEKSTRKSYVDFLSIFDSLQKPHPKKPQMIVDSDFPALVHKGGYTHMDNRERINPWKKQLDFHVMHIGFGMLYTKPTHRMRNLSKECWLHLEKQHMQRIQQHSHQLPENVLENELFIAVTAKSKAYDIIKKHSKHCIPSERDCTGIKEIVSSLSQAKIFYHKYDDKVITLKSQEQTTKNKKSNKPHPA